MKKIFPWILLIFVFGVFFSAVSRKLSFRLGFKNTVTKTSVGPEEIFRLPDGDPIPSYTF